MAFYLPIWIGMPSQWMTGFLMPERICTSNCQGQHLRYSASRLLSTTYKRVPESGTDELYNRSGFQPVCQEIFILVSVANDVFSSISGQFSQHLSLACHRPARRGQVRTFHQRFSAVDERGNRIMSDNVWDEELFTR